MKTILITFLIFSYQLFANELQWVDEQIDAIKPPREGISTSEIDSIKNPFLTLEKKKVKSLKEASNSTRTKHSIAKKEIKLLLEAIINQSALINGKWYNLNDKVDKYSISKIDRNMVLLSYKKKHLLLSTKTKNKNLRFKK